MVLSSIYLLLKILIKFNLMNFLWLKKALKDERILVSIHVLCYQDWKMKNFKNLTHDLKWWRFRNNYTCVQMNFSKKFYLSSYSQKFKMKSSLLKNVSLARMNYDLSQKRLREFDCLNQFPICSVLFLLLWDFSLSIEIFYWRPDWHLSL